MKRKYPIKTKYGAFQVGIWLDKRDKVYLAEIPSFNGATTQGSSLTDAKRMAADLIELLSEEAFAQGNVIIDEEKRIYAKGALARQVGPVKIAIA